MAKALTAEETIRLIAADMLAKGKPIPETVAEIPGFPFPTFAELKEALLWHRIVLIRFSSAYNGDIWQTFASAFQSARLNLCFASAVLLPIAGVVLGYLYSWWWLLLIISPYYALKRGTRLYNSVIFSSARQSELFFCFLFYARAIALTPPDFSKSIFWQGDEP